MTTREQDRSGMRRASVFFALSALVCLLGAAPIDIVKVRVPADRINDWFPKGSEIRSLSPAEFASLCEQAERGLERTRKGSLARIVRVDHFARVEEGLIQGRSDFTIRRNSEGVDWVPFDVWTPAVLSVEPRRDQEPSRLRSDERGRIGLRLDPDAPLVIRVNWQLRARANAKGKSFNLGLPSIPVSRLQVELAEGLQPELRPSLAVSQTTTAPGRKVWSFLGVGGHHELRVLDPVVASRRPESRPWVSGPTVIDVDPSISTWTTDWTVDLVDGGARTLDLEFDEGLELIEVKGEGVAAYRAGKEKQNTRATIEFRPEITGRTRLTLLCSPRVPESGTWRVPAVRPLNGVWTGGTMTIRLDASRWVSECRVLSGRRVPPDPSLTVNRPTVIAIDPSSPSSAAELTLRPAGPTNVAVVTGLIQCDDETRRMIAHVRWNLKAGASPVFVVDVPSGWSVSKVVSDADDESIPWRAEQLSGGMTRVSLVAPPIDESSRSVILNLYASSPAGDPETPFPLPRVRPRGVVIEDERWVAATAKTDLLIPTFGKGIAWLIPQDVLANSATLASEYDATRSRAIAWRWGVETAEARVRLARPASAGSHRVVERAVIRGERIDIEWLIETQSRNLREGLIVSLSNGGSVRPSWSLNGQSSSNLIVEPVGKAILAGGGSSPEAVGWRLRVKSSKSENVLIHGETSIPWSGKGPLPLFLLHDTSKTPTTLELRSALNLLIEADPQGMHEYPLEHEKTRFEELREAPADSRLVRLFATEAREPRLLVQSTAAKALSPSVVLRECLLTSVVEPGQEQRHRAMLHLSTVGDSTIELAFPPGVSISRIYRDGQPIEATIDDGRVSLALAGALNTRTITIDYRSLIPNASEGRLAPCLPSVSVPCASFSWEVTVPRRWELRSGSNQLIASDPRPEAPRHWLARSNPADGSGGPVNLKRQTTNVDASMPSDELLVNWLMSLEGDVRPVVVDRLALLETGWGPRSRMRASSVPETLETLGLTIHPYPKALLLTTKRVSAQGFEARDSALAERLTEATTLGTDRSDRFQSLERWRDEPTPRGYRSVAFDVWPSTGGDVSGWDTYRFASIGFPAEGATLDLIDHQADLIRQWGLGLVVACAVIFLGIQSRRALILVTIVVAAVALAGRFVEVNGWLNAGKPIVLAGWFGLIFVFFRERGLSGWRLDRPRSSNSARASFRSRSSLAGGLLFALVLTGGSTLGQEQQPLRILALLPFEGVPDPSAEPERVIIQLEDDRKLRDLAAALKSPAQRGITVTTSSHRVVRSRSDFAEVESTYEVFQESRGPAEWKFPVGDSLDMHATVDGRDAALVILLNEAAAAVQFLEPGRHLVRIERRVPVLRSPGGVRLSTPVMPVAEARIEVAGEVREAVEIVGRDGFLPSGALGSIPLGPTDRLELIWRNEQMLVNPLASSAEALVLWDSTEAGDLARVRLKLLQTEGLSSLRLQTEPGTFIRPDVIPGLIDFTVSSSSRNTECSIEVDPPLSPGAVISVVVWKPASAAGAAVGAVHPPRTFPRCVPVGMADFQGIVGLRQPASWSNRLGARGDKDQVTEEAFASLWGAFPAEPLTLAGTTRFAANSLVAVAVQPPASRPTARSVMSLEPRQGRLDVWFSSTLKANESITQATLGIPEGLVVSQIDAPGLSSFEQLNPGQFRLHFNGAAALSRVVHLKGRFNVECPLPLAESRQFNLTCQTPRWLDATNEATLVRINSDTKYDVAAESLKPALDVPPSAFGGEVTSAFSQVYRLEPTANTLTIKWMGTPSRVLVNVDSRLRLLDDSVEWAARIRVDVEGGPSESLFLRVPEEWVAGLTFESTETELKTSEISRSNGTVVFRIRPEHTIWGSASILLRSRRVLEKTTTIDFPDVSPLGQGRVEKSLKIIHGKAKKLGLEASSGLAAQAEDAASTQPVTDGPLNELVSASYRVESEPWTLRVKFEPGERSETSVGLARVLQSWILQTRRADGATWGLVRFDIDAGAGQWVAIDLPENAQAVWAVVDGQAVTALCRADGTWLIPIDRRGLGRAVLEYWVPARTHAGTDLLSTALPRIHRAVGPPLVALFADADLRARPSYVSLWPIEPAEWWVETAERRSRRLIALASELARLDQRVRDEYVDHASDWLLTERITRRAVNSLGDPLRQDLLARLDEAGLSLFETIESLDLADVQERVLSRNGEAEDRTGSKQRTSAGESARIRQIGQPFCFRSSATNEAGLPAVVWEPLPAKSQSMNMDFWIGVAASVLLPAFALLVIQPGHVVGRRLAVATLMGLVLWTLFAPLPGLALGLGALLGRASAREA